MWTDYAVMGKFETGRVYVVYQDKNNRFRKWDTLDGENHKARFGMSIASLGNINLDGMSAESPGGFQDFAVGAPYKILRWVLRMMDRTSGGLFIYSWAPGMAL